jgi:Ni/Fe-hydrogenase subunit HybB-like protein
VNFNSPLVVGRICDLYLFHRFIFCSGIQDYLPDLATVRDRAKTKLRKTYMASLLLDGAEAPNTGSAMKHYHWFWQVLSTPLVLSVHTIVSFDFATSLIPGWHTTIFPPYFVAGAIFSGFAMVQTLLIVSEKYRPWKIILPLGTSKL